MEEKTFVSLFLSLVFLQLCVESQSQLVPGFHIFGDSAVDAGNSIYLNTSFRANFAPYGIDFVVGQSGRFSNGLLITDVLATALGVDLAFPLVNGTNSIDFLYNNNQAFSYAYGIAGILPETGGAMGESLSLGQQVGLFKQTVEIYLPQEFKSSQEISQYISNSLFAVFIGSYHYIHNYLQPSHYNSSRQYNSEKFAGLLVTEYGNQLSELHTLGARRMVVFEIPPIGCYPVVLARIKSNTRCVENINNMVTIFNDKLGAKVKELSSILKDTTIILAKTYGLVYDMINDSSTYGLEEAVKPCCVVGKDGSGLCLPEKTPCEKRNTTLFWDQAHISEAANTIIAVKAFNGSGLGTPANIVDAIKSAKSTTTAHNETRPNPVSSKSNTTAHSGTRRNSASYLNILLVLAFFVVLSYL